MEARRVMPRGIFGYVWRVGGWHHFVLALLSVAVFLLSAAPLEVQRRVVNDAIRDGAGETILLLALTYAGLALAEGGIKLVLNIYRGWVSESAVRRLRRSIFTLVDGLPDGCRAAEAEGIEISMVLSEAEPIGGFAGIALSEPLLQGGI